MSLAIERDDVHRRLRWTITPPVTVAELIAAIDRQAEDGSWRYALIADVGVTILPPVYCDLMVARVSELTERFGPRGPVAMVAAYPPTLRVAGAHGANPRHPLAVFATVDEAARWLDSVGACRR